MRRYIFALALFICSWLHAASSPAPIPLAASLTRRTYPYFPDDPPSCPVCAKDYANINSCAEASVVFANFTMIIFNPGAFLDVIRCACTDTFQAAFPQCVDCFIRTNQSDVLNTPNLPSVVDGMRTICGMSSTLLGNVSGSSSTTAPTATSTSSGAMSIQTVLSIEATLGLLSLALALGSFGL